jgi:hypothetical protein
MRSEVTSWVEAGGPLSPAHPPYEHPVIFEEMTKVIDARDMQQWEMQIIAEAYVERYEVPLSPETEAEFKMRMRKEKSAISIFEEDD